MEIEEVNRVGSCLTWGQRSFLIHQWSSGHRHRSRADPQCYLCLEKLKFEGVGLGSAERNHAAPQPVRIHRPWQQVALAVQGANAMRRLRVTACSCMLLERLEPTSSSLPQPFPSVIEGVIKLPGRAVCSQLTPRRPPGGKWAMLVTRHASSVCSDVIWGLTMDSRANVKFGSVEKRWEDEQSFQLQVQYHTRTDCIKTSSVAMYCRAHVLL